MGDWLFSYDAMDRLTAAAAGGSAPSAFRGQSAGWSYDSYGNRKSEIVGGTVTAPMPSTSTASYTAATNQVASVNGGAGLAYDAAGDVTQDPLNSYKTS
jgi:hypothetical protein